MVIFQTYFSLPEGNITFKNQQFDRKINYQWAIFNDYVRLPEGNHGRDSFELGYDTPISLVRYLLMGLNPQDDILFPPVGCEASPA